MKSAIINRKIFSELVPKTKKNNILAGLHKHTYILGNPHTSYIDNLKVVTTFLNSAGGLTYYVSELYNNSIQTSHAFESIYCSIKCNCMFPLPYL